MHLSLLRFLFFFFLSYCYLFLPFCDTARGFMRGFGFVAGSVFGGILSSI